MIEDKKECWNCIYQKIGGNTFLGECTYFSTVGKENKAIPPSVVDKGCKLWKLKDIPKK